MGKVKSAIITALVCLAVIALMFFAVVSFNYGTGKRLNSVLSSISLGSEFTGDAETVIYPEGILTAREYELYLPQEEDFGDSSEYAEQLAEYTKQYQPTGVSGLYYDTEEISSDELETVKTQVASDVSVLDSRLSKLGYSSYSVSVYNDYGIKISVATGYTYADYANAAYLNDETSSSTKLSEISSVLSVITLDGSLTLRNADASTKDNLTSETDTNSLVRLTEDLNSYFKGISSYSSGGTYAIKIKLTSDGKDAFYNITNKMVDNDDYSSASIDFYVGADQLLSLTIEEVMDEKTFYITVSDELSASCYAAVLNSVVNDEVIQLNYSSEISDSISVTAPYSSGGRYAAIAVAVATLLLYVAAFVVLTIRYKKLGSVAGLSLLIYLLAMIYAVFLMGVQLTLGGIMVILVGGALLSICNVASFEDVHYFVKHGNVMHNAIKQGYKRHLGAILDIHVVLALISLVVALAVSGSLASYALLVLIGTVGSYALYWFTRLMWYVTSSPQKNKFAFCGFKREVVEDD